MASAKALLLSMQIPKARANAKFQFPCFPLLSYRSFDEFSQKSRKFIIFILLGKETGSNFRGYFDGGWKTFQGSSIPENTGKIQREMGEKLGAQF